MSEAANARAERTALRLFLATSHVCHVTRHCFFVIREHYSQHAKSRIRRNPMHINNLIFPTRNTLLCCASPPSAGENRQLSSADAASEYDEAPRNLM